MSSDAASPTTDGSVPVPRSPARPVAVSEGAPGGRLAARVREARARLEPERPSVPAPRSPEGVVPPPEFGHGSRAPAADLVRAVDHLLGELVDLEQDPHDPGRRALVRAVELDAAGVPDEGWSAAEGFDLDALAEGAELAGTLHDAAAALLERLDAEDRAAPAVEIDAVVTALRVARMVLDLDSFTRGGRGRTGEDPAEGDD